MLRLTDQSDKAMRAVTTSRKPKTTMRKSPYSSYSCGLSTNSNISILLSDQSQQVSMKNRRSAKKKGVKKKDKKQAPPPMTDPPTAAINAKNSSSAKSDKANETKSATQQQEIHPVRPWKAKRVHS
ncbi:expressed unknown protein [Seminavis robusta]|uniref:Uncharacterized protein n=1 Tax=Seminavis robusta TaxID=568900 RepID=A0A9N8EAB9_9STRA|nr:expressed unknown protein [Seminavis robusta]|eukprot:Sro801_g204420.1 n/a (126) ;mRNA; f:8243-8620